MRPIFAVLLTAAALTACTSAEEWSALEELSDGADARVIQSHEPRWKEGDAWTVAFEPSVTIGAVEGAHEYQLFDVLAAARQSDGNFIVADGGAREVRLYDGNGTYVKTLGGPGSGPGEFQNPVQILVTAEDSVLVWDAKLFRVSRFDPVGELVNVQSVEMAQIAKAVQPPFYPAAVKLMPDDQLLVRLIEKGGDKSGAVVKYQPRAGRMRSGALRVSMDYSKVDTLMFFGDAEQVTVNAPWGETPVVPALAKTTVTAVHGTSSKTCIGEQELPEVTCFAPGEQRMLIRWTAEPAAVTDDEIAFWRDTTIDLYTPKLREDDVVRMLDQVTRPVSRPPYSVLALDRVGNLWVASGPTNGAESESLDYLVFNPTGELLGKVALPMVHVFEIGDDYVLGLHRDELEVEYLRVYELEKP